MEAAMALVSSLLRGAGLAVAMLLLAACGAAPAPARQAVDTHADDACAVCGMYLDGSPGPRAQAWMAGRAKPLLFDSTRDFFAFVLQPENQASMQEMFVQDSTNLDWQTPTHAAVSFIDARSAFYVAWQPLPGSMGPTLAPFATHAAADAFVRAHGGGVLAFDEVTPALIAALDDRCPPAGTATGGLPCTAVPPPAGPPGDPANRYPSEPRERALVAHPQP
jgi:copper chaperone NosL